MARTTVAITRTASIVDELERTDHRHFDSPGSLLLGQESERKRIARELHDDIGQRLALLSMTLEDVAQAADAPPGLRNQLRTARGEVERLSRDLHRICHNLHPVNIAYVGLMGAIRRLCSDFSKQMGIEVEFISDDSVRPTSEDVALALYRVTQEALSNVARHSRSTSATVSLVQHAGAIQLTITDCGVGFDATQLQSTDGLGLTSIRERASTLDAALDVRSVPSFGTTIDLRVPVRDSNTAPGTEPLEPSAANSLG